MGSPFWQKLLNVCKGNFEYIRLENCPPHFKINVYKRFFGYLFLLFRSNYHAKKFILKIYLNIQQQDKNVEEVEENSLLSFLDRAISRETINL